MPNSRLESGFTLVELIISLLISAILMVGAYQLLIRNLRPVQTAGMQAMNSMNLSHAQARIEQDLRNAATITTRLCQDSTQLNGCSKFVVSSITPLYGLDVDGNSVSNLSSIRLVIPDHRFSAVNLVDVMNSDTDPVLIEASNTAGFEQNGFALVEDGQYSEVFQITNTIPQPSNSNHPVDLRHSNSSAWNIDAGTDAEKLSKPYTTFATVRPAKVVTIGLRKVGGETILVRREEGAAAREEVLSRNVSNFQASYLQSFKTGGLNLGNNPGREYWSSITKVSLNVSPVQFMAVLRND